MIYTLIDKERKFARYSLTVKDNFEIRDYILHPFVILANNLQIDPHVCNLGTNLKDPYEGLKVKSHNLFNNTTWITRRNKLYYHVNGGIPWDGTVDHAMWFLAKKTYDTLIEISDLFSLDHLTSRQLTVGKATIFQEGSGPTRKIWITYA